MTAAVVVGAGVSGLTTAICLAEQGHDVEVWAGEPPSRTVSAVAGAMWGPSFLQPMAATMRWTEVSLREFTALAGVPGSGVRMAEALTVGEFSGEVPPQLLGVPDRRPCPADQLPDGFTAGSLGTMPLVDMPVYLAHLVGRLEAAGGRIVERTARSLVEAAGAADVVLNCAGLGARDLAGDPSVTPVRGQHVVLTNPGIDRMMMEITGAPEFTAIFPHPGRVVCGGNSAAGDRTTDPDDDLTERILARCRAAEPRLHDAGVLDVVVGLRPVRPSVRVEPERAGAVRVVHNYGHGGQGVSLSWGCARDAAALATAPVAAA